MKRKKSIESKLLVEINKNIKKWIFMKAMKEREKLKWWKKRSEEFYEFIISYCCCVHNIHITFFSPIQSEDYDDDDDYDD